MEPRKGIELCPEIVGTILERHDVAFAFAGRDLFGYMADTLLPRVKARTLRGSIHYLGELDLATVRACLHEADIFFLPSLWENCPYSCIEAMAAGRAIVCSDQGGMPELVQHEATGLLARSGDAGSYVVQLERMIADQALRQRLGDAARRTVETSLTDVRIAERSVACYRAAFDVTTTADEPRPSPR
jgi:glycosyltransferase involved in cell wall biosynthesis